MKYKHACLLPFNHMAVRPDGKILPCCIYRWDDVPEDLNIFHPDPFNHPYMKNLREQMIKDEYVSGCTYCYQNEKTSGNSFRTAVDDAPDNFGIVNKIDNESSLTYLDLSISNTCNNKCRMCGPDLSTSWYSDAKKLKKKIPKGIIKNPFIENGDFKNLRHLKILGGEPLMEQDVLIDILQRCNLKLLSVNLVTNTTLRPNGELFALLKRCKSVNISLSVDSYGDLNSFLRSGSVWSTVKKNIKWYNKNFDANVHSVASIYNINVLQDLILFCKKINIPHNYVLIDGPDYMMPRNLPTKYKQDLISKFKHIMQKPNYLNYNIFNVAIKELSKQGDTELFLSVDKIMNDIRNENWYNLNPELYDAILEYKN